MGARSRLAPMLNSVQGIKMSTKRPETLHLAPDPDDPFLTESIQGIDQTGQPTDAAVTNERPMTLFLNGQEIVTIMTIGDHPRELAVGYLVNQNMLTRDDQLTDIELSDGAARIDVKTRRQTDYEWKLKKRTLTSGCAQGTVFGDVMEKFGQVTLDPNARISTSALTTMLAEINRTPSLYLKAGAIHGCVLADGTTPIAYVEDVGRHNAVDKIAGHMWLNDISPKGKTFFTTGRLTSEMVIKTVQMEIPILISRSGFTAWGVDLARQAGLTLIGRAKGSRFICLAGAERLIFDHGKGKTS